MNMTQSPPQPPPERLAAQDYLLQLETYLDHQAQDDTAPDLLLVQLKANLQAAINNYDRCHQTGGSFEECLMQQSSLLWFCNQCEYYLTQPLDTTRPQPKKFRNQQMRSVIQTSIRFKIYSQIRRLIFRKNSSSLPWRDLIIGLRHWN